MLMLTVTNLATLHTFTESYAAHAVDTYRERVAHYDGHPGYAVHTRVPDSTLDALAGLAARPAVR